MRSSKAQIYTKIHKIPEIRFEDQPPSSFSGIVIFHLLFGRFNLKARLKKHFSHLNISPIFGHHLIVILLIIHFVLGFKRLRQLDYYRDDPMVLRLMGLNRLPDVSTISRSSAQMETQSTGEIQKLSRTFVIEGLQREQFPRSTLDFDGSVLSTQGHAEGSAIGFNKEIISLLAAKQVQFTASVPFVRFAELKSMTDACESWSVIDENRSFYHTGLIWGFLELRLHIMPFSRYGIKALLCRLRLLPGIVFQIDYP